MKSIKPGRAPSFMGGIVSIFLCVFGVFWTIMAISMDSPTIFPIFGVFFVFMGIIQAIYNFRNATGKKRYSAFDITDASEEPDPLNQRYGSDVYTSTAEPDTIGGNYCPHCGQPTKQGHAFCKSCGKAID